MDPKNELLYSITSHYWARAIQVAAHLGLVDLVLSGSNTSESLAERTNIDPWRMQRFLRVLVALGLFEKTDKKYSITEKGSYLSKDSENSLKSVATMHYYLFTAFTELEEVLRTGKPGYELSTGRKHFDAMADMPDFAEAFDLTMNRIFIPETDAMVEKYNFGKYRKIMDVGGGNGEVLLAALARHSDLTAQLFDLPHVVERATDRIEKSEFGSRCSVFGGSFFDELPKGSDAILLRHIIHDWDVEDALIILRNCRDAVGPDGRVLIAESLIEDSDSLTLPIRLDLSMMTFYNGAERTLEEYRELVTQADLEIVDVTKITPALSIMELIAKNEATSSEH